MPDYSATVTPLHEQLVGRIRTLLKVLFATVLFVLLIACANVANLLLMRALGRDREMSVRLALGAGRWRLAHQLTVESLLLTGTGGLLGTVTAIWGLRALLATLPADFPLPRIHEIAVDSTVLWFAITLCVTLGLLFGRRSRCSFPAVAICRNVCETGAVRWRRASAVFSQIMVVTEIAVALVLVIGAGLMIRSFLRLHQVELGFQTERVLTVRMSLLPGKPTSQAQVIDDILRRVTSLATGDLRKFHQYSCRWRASIPARGTTAQTCPSRRAPTGPSGDISIVMPDYFRTMGIPMLVGRDFGDQDRFGGDTRWHLESNCGANFLWQRRSARKAPQSSLE